MILRYKGTVAIIGLGQRTEARQRRTVRTKVFGISVKKGRREEGKKGRRDEIRILRRSRIVTYKLM